MPARDILCRTEPRDAAVGVPPARDSTAERLQMAYLIGMDEAGYGPNFGPLVVSASVWHVAGTDDDLYKRLRKVICKSAPQRDGPQRRLAIADSKVLYSPAQGLRALERGVLAALTILERCPADWFDAWQMLDPQSATHLPALPWHLNYNLPLPLAADSEDLASLVPRFAPRVRRARRAACGPAQPGCLRRAIQSIGGRTWK